ncbi:MAG: iron-containing alcohol dehydrogenase [Bacteroidales bacterium]|jgi:NADP-dependent alcohol dehydrogenase|nr:iron-containing alcohol dehydrogenase [Bacteroidales bacterium]
MNNFSFYNPTKIIFGKGEIAKLDTLIPKTAKILLIYGSGSIKKNGVYQQVIAALGKRKVTEFAGIEPNPFYETCLDAVKVIKQKKIDFLLPVGGGSVIDATKFIAAANFYEGKDCWEIMSKQSEIKEALPFGSVLTLPATGSEMNKGAVITKSDTKEKLAFHSDKVFPIFSILDPETTYSLPKRQVTNGIIDTFVHVMEQYCAYSVRNQISDRFAESILQTLVEEGSKVIKNPTDYDIKANLMWAATMALNGLIACGQPEDWATHMIGHELTAFYDLDHGVTLSIVLPGLLRVMKKDKLDKLAQMATRVFGINEGSRGERADKAILAIERFFRTVGAPTHLSDVNLDASCIEPIVERMEKRGWKLGEKGNITPAKVREILQNRL